MSMKPKVNSRELNALRMRIERLRRQGLVPIEVVMSPQTWEGLRRQYCGTLQGMAPKVISARDVLGVRNRLVPDAQGATIRYFGGMDLPPDQAVEDGFIDLGRIRVGRAAGVRRGA